MAAVELAADVAARILIFAPVGRDAQLTRDMLERASIPCYGCASLTALCSAFEEQGCGAILLTEEALEDSAFAELAAALDRQPAWSDVPVMLLAGSSSSHPNARTLRSIEVLRNVTLLERPIRIAAAVKTIQAALRSRARQYELREVLVALHRARSDAESANRLKDEFLATLSHELRTPLNAILGWTSMLRHGQVQQARMPRIFEALDRNAQAQAQLIGDVLDISRIITGKLKVQMSTVNVSEVMARALDAIRPGATARNIAVAVRDDPDAYVRGDIDRLQQVFWNLLSNALKFTPPGGAIQIETVRNEGTVSVTVTDSGVGIAPEFMPFIFDRFRQADQTTTRAHGGLGLGLAIAKHLVELQGGSVTALSDGPGRGASYSVALAAAAREPERAKPWQSDTVDFNVSLDGRSILVVDDDESSRDVVAAVLEGARAQVALAASAEEGWAQLNRKRPDLIVADLGVPIENGFAFIRRVRRLVPDPSELPAIALSAYADAPSQEAALAAGFTAWVPKPAPPHALLHLIGALLGAGPL